MWCSMSQAQTYEERMREAEEQEREARVSIAVMAGADSLRLDVVRQ